VTVAELTHRGSGHVETDALRAALDDDTPAVSAILDRMPIGDLEALFAACRCVTWRIRSTRAWAEAYGTKETDRGA